MLRSPPLAAGLAPWTERGVGARGRQPRVRRMIVVTDLVRRGHSQLGEFTRSDRYARAWNASGRRFNKYEIDTQAETEGYAGDTRIPARASVAFYKWRPATLKDLTHFHFKLPPGDTLADSAELDAERANNCSYCGKPTRKGSALIDGQAAHKACVKEFEK